MLEFLLLSLDKADKKAEINRKLKAEEARVVREEELKEIMKKVKSRRGSDSLSTGSEDDSNVPLQRPNLRRRSSSGRSSRSHSPSAPISNRRRSRSRERKRPSHRDDRRSRSKSRERRYRRSRDRSRERDKSSRAGGGGSGDRYRRN